MIIFIFGEDNFQSQKRLKELKEKFKEKFGGINISIFEFEKKELVNTSKIISEIESVPFLGAKRLIIIKNLIVNAGLEDKAKIVKKITKIPESSIVIFYESGVPKKNDRLNKVLLKIAKSEEFFLPKGPALIDWIEKEAAARGGRIERGATEKLIQFLGTDIRQLSNEIDKLINYAHPRVIKKEDVSALTLPLVEAKIFDLVDALARRDGRLALLFLHRLLSLGEKREYLFAMIVYGFRNLILVKYLLKKNKSEAEIKNILHLHPFVVKKTVGSAGLFSFLELKRIYHRLVKTNAEMHGSNKDPISVLDLLLAEICVRQ